MALAAVQELQEEKASLQLRISRLEEQAAQLRGQTDSSALGFTLDPKS